MDKETAKKEIQALVDKFDKEKKAKELSTYSEQDTKNALINPLLEALGWNISDRSEIASEQNIKGAGRPDYAFKINGITQFFLEAKKVSADLDDEEWATQVINYSWNKVVTYAVLTNFESLKVFNAQRIDKTDLMDKLVFELPYTEFVKDFETLWLVSKESFQKKELDKYAEKIGKKEKSVAVVTVIKKLNEDIEWCRERLTESFEVCNGSKNLSRELVDEGVQKLLDRLIFLRVAEDRGVEPNILTNLLREAEQSSKEGKHNVFEAMTAKFRELDKVYDSNLFTEHPFEGWESWDGALDEVIKKLYGKKGHYEYNFKEMPSDVLGSVYESYLSYKLSTAQNKNKKLFGSDTKTVIHKDAKKRKEQGIFYTPPFVVDYIVRNALKPVLDKCKSINDLKKIKVLDPACGSGSFLIKALEAIEEKYIEFGVNDNFIKRRIILENIYGVDLDAQAVEIARLNLVINSLDEKGQLPILSENIKNGNSLISGTYKELEKQFGPDWRDKKPFNWQEEFSDVFKQGGFDVIIGNPPYISYYSKQAQTDENTKSELDFLINHYDFVEDKDKLGRLNILMFFIERCIKNVKTNGYIGLIVDTNLHSNPSVDIRKYISEKTQIIKIVDEIKAFEDAASSQIILILKKQQPSILQRISWEHLDEVNFYLSKQDNQAYISLDNQYSFKEKKEDIVESILLKIKKFPTLELLVGKDHIRTCITFTGKKDYFVKNGKSSKNDYPLLEGSYSVAFQYAPIIYKNYINYDLKLRDKLNEEYKKQQIKENKRSPMVIGLGNLDQFKSPKIFIRLSDKRITASYTKEVVAADLSLYILTLPNLSDEDNKLSLFYLLGFLNSKVVTFYMKGLNLIRNLTTGTPQIRLNDMRQIPIPPYKENNDIEDLVDKMLSLNKELRDLPENSEKWLAAKSEIEKTDRKIDEEVYKIYGLTEEEIKIVEG